MTMTPNCYLPSLFRFAPEERARAATGEDDGESDSINDNPAIVGISDAEPDNGEDNEEDEGEGMEEEDEEEVTFVTG